MGCHTGEVPRTPDLAVVGKNVQRSRLALIHAASSVSIGENSLIDDFCVLSDGEEESS